jgi:hypothetical protein
MKKWERSVPICTLNFLKSNFCRVLMHEALGSH